MPHLPTEYPDFGLTPEQRHEAVFGHYYEYPGMDGARGEIWCYTDRFSYAPGEIVTLFVSSTAPHFDIAISRDGSAVAPVFERQGLGARWQDTPDQCSVEGCGWQASFDFRIDEAWPSGAYRLTVRAEGSKGAPIHHHHLFILRPRPGNTPGRILQIAATGSWTAYNTWGGSNHYQGITGPDRNQYATSVSTQRPWCRGFVVLPADAPRVPIEIAMPPMTEPRYPHMEWAFATGHSKKYASAGWASYDSHFFRWAEQRGYALDLATQHELHFAPEILDGYDCAVFVGHDEYWTWEMRDAVDAYRRAGRPRCPLRRQLPLADAAGGRRAPAGLLQIPRPRRGPGLPQRRHQPHHQRLGGSGNRQTGRDDVRPQCHRRRLCGMGRLHAARRARVPDLSAGALGVSRHRPLLWRFAWRRKPHLRLRG